MSISTAPTSRRIRLPCGAGHVRERALDRIPLSRRRRSLPPSGERPRDCTAWAATSCEIGRGAHERPSDPAFEGDAGAPPASIMTSAELGDSHTSNSQLDVAGEPDLAARREPDPLAEVVVVEVLRGVLAEDEAVGASSNRWASTHHSRLHRQHHPRRGRRAGDGAGPRVDRQPARQADRAPGIGPGPPARRQRVRVVARHRRPASEVVVIDGPGSAGVRLSSIPVVGPRAGRPQPARSGGQVGDLSVPGRCRAPRRLARHSRSRPNIPARAVARVGGSLVTATCTRMG